MIKLGNIFGSLSSKAQETAKTAANVIKDKPVYRFGGLQQMGAQVRPKDTRTTGEIIATIEELAERNPVVKGFVKDLRKMDPKHMNLVSDTLELASRHEFTMTPVNMNTIELQNGKSALQALLEAYPKASKDNPEALELAQEVINNTDTTTSKYFLSCIANSLGNTQLKAHLKAVKPLLKDIADSTLKGGYTGTFDKQKKFIDYINIFTNVNAKPEKIEILPQLTNAVDKMSQDNGAIYVDKFINSTTPIKQVQENINILPNVAEMLYQDGKSLDVVDFVNKNVNLY